MNNPLKLHKTASKSVYILQTHQGLLPNTLPHLDIHPKNNGDLALAQIKDEFQLPHHPIFMRQVHGDNSIVLNSIPTKHFWQSADACYTDTQNIICAVMTADCLPVLVTDQHASFVAAVHCGWRSLYQDILKKTLDKIGSSDGLIVWFGPAICSNHYQVDEAFKDHYLQRHPEAEQAFSEVIDNHCYADLKALAMAQLKNENIRRIEDCQICTYEDESYDSWRQNKTPNRQASMIWIKATGHQK